MMLPCSYFSSNTSRFPLLYLHTKMLFSSPHSICHPLCNSLKPHWPAATGIGLCLVVSMTWLWLLKLHEASKDGLVSASQHKVTVVHQHAFVHLMWSLSPHSSIHYQYCHNEDKLSHFCYGTFVHNEQCESFTCYTPEDQPRPCKDQS